MKQYDFDIIINRRGSNCVKYDALTTFYGTDDITPMWVADMDFASPDFVLDAINERCQHPILGYATPPEGYTKALIAWMAEHYGIAADKKELHFIPGIVAGISYALLALTQPGDKVLVTTPVYPPFINLPVAAGRQLVCSPLNTRGRESGKANSCGRFSIDFDDFESKAKDCKVFILSNPHNPAGTVWGKDVLARIASICHRYGLTVISDEIHADLTLPGHEQVSYSTVSPEARSHSLTFLAPSKTFNIAGLSSSTCYVSNPALRETFFGWLDGLGVAGGNIFAFTGAEAAFTHGNEWLRQLLEYLKGNVETLRNFLDTEMPKVKALLPEASYLAWLDFSDLKDCLTEAELANPHKSFANRLITKAKVALNDGTTFGGKGYECCFRINLGCPRNTLTDALFRIKSALS